MSVTYVSLSLSFKKPEVGGANDVDEQVVQHKLQVHMYVYVCMNECMYVSICEKILYISAPRQR